MKRVKLVRTIKGFGCILVRHGGRHDWYRNPTTGVSQPGGEKGSGTEKP